MSGEKYTTYAAEVLERACEAARRMREWDQAATDRVVTAVAETAYALRHELAEAACEETGIGVVGDKTVKNAWAAMAVYHDIIERRSAGCIDEDAARGVTTFAEPRGPVLALTPLTNPTSTVIAKLLVALKARCPLILSPHRAARKCSKLAAQRLLEAAQQAGAPEAAVQVVSKADKGYLEAILEHRALSLIVATSTGKLVKWAQDSGRPCLGVGPGNVPAIVDDTADPAVAAQKIVTSKGFDHGTVCASEQALIATPKAQAPLRAALEARGAVFVPAELVERLGEVCFDKDAGTMRAEVVGRPATVLAERIGLEVPAETRLLVAELPAVRPEGTSEAPHPLAHEILAPVLAYLPAADPAHALEMCLQVVALGGVGHTAVLHSEDEALIARFAETVPVHRLLLNQPATQGALGGFTNALRPSLSLACGARAGNDVAANLTLEHLLEYRHLLAERPNPGWQAVAEEAAKPPQNPSAAEAQAARDRYRRG